MDEEARVSLSLDERAVRALHQAVSWTCQNWTGQGECDQEELYNLRTFLQGAIFEFTVNKPSAKK